MIDNLINTYEKPMIVFWFGQLSYIFPPGTDRVKYVSKIKKYIHFLTWHPDLWKTKPPGLPAIWIFYFHVLPPALKCFSSLRTKQNIKDFGIFCPEVVSLLHFHFWRQFRITIYTLNCLFRYACWKYQSYDRQSERALSSLNSSPLLDAFRR